MVQTNCSSGSFERLEVVPSRDCLVANNASTAQRSSVLVVSLTLSDNGCNSPTVASDPPLALIVGASLGGVLFVALLLGLILYLAWYRP